MTDNLDEVMEIISLAEAKAHGLEFYFTGEPCKHGSVAQRRVSGRRCTCPECVGAARAAAKKYRDTNPEKHAARIRDYVALNRDSVLTRKRARYAENRESNIQKMKDWRAQNADRVSAYAKEYRSNNVSLRTSLQSIRRARKLSATPGWFGELDDFVMQEAASLCRDRELATGIRWDVDHMIPMQARRACGLHVALNIQVIPASLNRSKINKMMLVDPDEWLAHL